MLRYLLVILFCIAAGGSNASVPPLPATKHTAVLKTDSSMVHVRHFDDNALKTYAKSEAFQYHEVEGQVSLWTRFWRWFWNWLAHLFTFSRPNGVGMSWLEIVFKCLQYLVILLGVAAIVFFVLKVAGIDMAGLLKRKPVSANIPYAESLENIHAIDFDTEIEKAVSQQNYRLAVRMLYLKCLKQLNESRLIDWQPDKTNRTYVNELQNTSRYNAFKLLTKQFEYIWYGNFTIDALVFKNIHLMFHEFKNIKA